MKYKCEICNHWQMGIPCLKMQNIVNNLVKKNVDKPIII